MQRQSTRTHAHLILISSHVNTPQSQAQSRQPNTATDTITILPAQPAQPAQPAHPPISHKLLTFDPFKPAPTPTSTPTPSLTATPPPSITSRLSFIPRTGRSSLSIPRTAAPDTRASAKPHPTYASSPRRRNTAPPPTFLLEINPPPHNNLATIELSFLISMSSLFLASHSPGSLSRVSPAEIVEFPVCVGRQDTVPDGEGEEVDQHPEDVGPAGGGEDD